MKTSEAGFALIRLYEGVKLTAYPDPGTGHEPWTIGVGHTRGVKEGDICTEEQADAWLVEDVRHAENCIDKCVEVPLTQAEFDALVSFVFNVGCGAFIGSTLLIKLNIEDYEGAEAQFQRWNKAGGRVMAGLTKRRKAEQDMFASAQTGETA